MGRRQVLRGIYENRKRQSDRWLTARVSQVSVRPRAASPCLSDLR